MKLQLLEYPLTVKTIIAGKISDKSERQWRAKSLQLNILRRVSKQLSKILIGTTRLTFARKKDLAQEEND